MILCLRVFFFFILILLYARASLKRETDFYLERSIISGYRENENVRYDSDDRGSNNEREIYLSALVKANRERSEFLARKILFFDFAQLVIKLIKNNCFTRRG